MLRTAKGCAVSLGVKKTFWNYSSTLLPTVSLSMVSVTHSHLWSKKYEKENSRNNSDVLNCMLF